MFDRFKAGFRVDEEWAQPNEAGAQLRDAALTTLLSQFGGASFEKGLYRIMAADVRGLAKDFIASAFAEFSGRATAFGYDWLGTIFAVDAGRLEDGSPGVLMFEPDAAEALEVPCNVLTFHESGLFEFTDAALAADFHTEWLSSGGAVPNPRQCVGYKRPLFLGGEDVVENLEISDLEVYWSMLGQMIQQLRAAT